MPFKKLKPDLKEALEDISIVAPTPLQTLVIPVIKSGANVYCTGAKDEGKTMALVMTTLQKLNFEAKGTAPRAVVLVENKAKALALYDTFLKVTKYSSIRMYVGYEELHIDVQKSEIFEGVDVLISTPGTLNKLFLLNGVSTSQLKIFSVDDADFLIQKTPNSNILSVSQSIIKCQYVLYCEKMHPKLVRFQDYFMERAKAISL